MKKQKELNKTASNVVENFYSQLALNQKDVLNNKEYLNIVIFTEKLKNKLTQKIKIDTQYNFIICEKDFPTSFNVYAKEEYINENIYTVSSNFKNHSFEVVDLKIDGSWYIDDINCINK